jgi:hypothetical protein
MRKLLNNPWVVGALALAALAFVGMPLLPRQSAGGSPDSQSSVVVDDAVSVDETGEETLPAGAAPSDIALALKELAITTPLRDPFAARIKTLPASVIAEQAPVPDSVDTLRLSAIWIQGANTFVLINGAIRQAGDAFSRFKIESATRDGVWVTHWKGRDFLSLGTDFTLITPAARSEVGSSL